ncbi:MAG: thioesterase family protein [Nannocystaceae bacterium]
MSERGSFYVLDGERLIPTDYTRGPWDPALQHGGPPTAAIARAVAHELDDGWVLGRATFELIRPVAVAPLTIAVRERGRTRATRRFDAELRVAGKVAIEARLLAVAAAPLELPPTPALPRPPGPEAAEPFVLPIFRERDGYHRAFEMRRVRGRYGEGPLCAWMRAVVDLVAGEPIAPYARALIVADSCNGLSPVVDPQVFSFINADLSVQLARSMVGEWICVDARTALDGRGRGVASGQLYDQEGWLGLAAQGLIVRRRTR